MEVAPRRLWAEPERASGEQVKRALEPMHRRGLAVSGFQAILFQRADLVLFEEKSREALADYLKKVAALCSQAGGSYLVFGAPKNRWVPEGMKAAEAWAIARDFFRELGLAAEQLGVFFGLEANPLGYGCNFCTRSEEAARLVAEINSPGVRWHVDAGALAMNGEGVEFLVGEFAEWIGSVHASEAYLAGFEKPWFGHRGLGDGLRRAGYRGYLSIEMKRQAEGLEAVKRAVEVVRDLYGL